MKTLKAIIETMMLKVLFIIFMHFNIFMPVPYIPSVEASFESPEIISFNCQLLLINVLKGFLASFKDAG